VQAYFEALADVHPLLPQAAVVAEVAANDEDSRHPQADLTARAA
jgi:hypothetical protein